MLSEASRIMQGQLNGPDCRFKSVEIDTRRLESGALYFAIRGEVKNGHEFIAQAIQKDACAAVADQSFHDQNDICHIRVDDSTLALGDLARHWRKNISVPVVGITGSNGKTTVCRIVDSIFAEAIPGVSPQGSFNNHWGVPLTLLKMRDNHQSAIIEMGMNHAGELAYLGKIVRPDIGLITNAAAAHLQGLKTIEGVAEAKAELIDYVTREGIVVLNRDDPFFGKWKLRAGQKKCITFGVHEQSDVRILNSNSRTLCLEVFGETGQFDYVLLGKHNRLNAAAAVAVAIAADVSIQAITIGLRKVRAIAGRLYASSVSPELLLIDDSFNANLASMRAAIDVLSDQVGEKVLVLGAMRELGEDSHAIHAQVGAYAHSRGIDRLITLVDREETDYLEDMSAYIEGFGKAAEVCVDVADVVARIQTKCIQMTVLVKGSKFASMERVVNALVNKEENLC
jgi:UDP-N-acetylmuramoyl-tripeptide--D-alanyl-D-alanine ligase